MDSPNVGDNLILTCTVTVVNGISSSLVIVEWNGGDLLSESPRITIANLTNDGLKYTTMIIFSPLLSGDSGLYYCSASVIGFDEADNSDSELVVVNGKYTYTLIIKYIQ